MREIYLTRGLAVDAYDLMYEATIPSSSVAGDLAFYLAQARRTGGPVLELGAGTGRVALPLAVAGFRVTGLDLSAAMLARARRKIRMARFESRIALVRGNMARFDLGRRFPLVLIPFRAFMHLHDPTDQRACLACARRHLSRGGRLVVDLFDPNLRYCHDGPVEPNWSRRHLAVPETGGTITVRAVSRRNDALAQTLREVWEFVERDRRGRVARRQRNSVTLRWTYSWEMRYLLELAGFRVLACYGDFRGGPPRHGREQVWVAAPA